MKGRDPTALMSADRDISPLPTQPFDSVGDAEDVLRRRAAQQHHDLRRDQLDLPRQKRAARLDLLRRGVAVARWTPIHDIRDVDILGIKRDRPQHTVQKLAGAAHEGLALQVLVAARRFADEHDAGLRIAPREAQRFRGALEAAPVECRERLAQGFQRLALGGRGVSHRRLRRCYRRSDRCARRPGQLEPRLGPVERRIGHGVVHAHGLIPGEHRAHLFGVGDVSHRLCQSGSVPPPRQAQVASRPSMPP